MNYSDIKDDYYIHRNLIDFDNDTYLYLIKYINKNDLEYDKFISVYKSIYKIIVSDSENMEEYSLFIKLIPYIDNNLINKERFEILYSLVENKKNLLYLCKKYTEAYKYYAEKIDLGYDNKKINDFLNLFIEYRKYCIDDNVFISTFIKFFYSKFSYDIENDIEILNNKNQDKDIYELNESVEKLNENYRNTKKKLEEDTINIEKQKNKLDKQIEKKSSIINDYINDKINPFNEQLKKIENDFSNNNDEINKEIINYDNVRRYKERLKLKKFVSKYNKG